MKEKKIKQLKNEYMNIPIPEELDFVVRKALKESGVKSMKKNNGFKSLATIAASILVAVGIFTAGINTNPAFAQTLSKVPVVGSLVKVLTFREYTVKEEKFDAEIKVPVVQGLENKALENSLNEKYLNENKKLYEQFMAEMKQLKEIKSGNIGVYSGYEVKTDNEKILSVCRYVTEIAADSFTVNKYDTIDKKKQILLTLPSLFKDDTYIDVISENIIKQMKEQVKTDEGKVYWLDDDETMPADIFKKIDKNQNFYISKDGKLVISFDQFEVAPGYMGTPEFVIPTDVLSGILLSNEYIK